MNKALQIVSVLALIMSPAMARDDGRYAQSPLKPWFDQLKSHNGLCCSVSDGVVIQDPDWRTVDHHYEVYLKGQWMVVPDDAVIGEPNRAGQAMVWPFAGGIRCFMPGVLS